MRTGNKLFLIVYALVCLLSGTHSAVMPIKIEPALVSMWEYFASLGEKEEHADEDCFFVAYALNGGVNHEDNKSIIYKSDFPVTLGVPTKAGYNFAGWYVDKKFRHKITELNSTTTSEIILFAKWTKKIDNY